MIAAKAPAQTKLRHFERAAVMLFRLGICLVGDVLGAMRGKFSNIDQVTKGSYIETRLPVPMSRNPPGLPLRDAESPSRHGSKVDSVIYPGGRSSERSTHASKSGGRKSEAGLVVLDRFD